MCWEKSNFSAGGKQEQGQELRADFLCGHWLIFLPAVNLHLQCERLQCFSSKQAEEAGYPCDVLPDVPWTLGQAKVPVPRNIGNRESLVQTSEKLEL